MCLNHDGEMQIADVWVTLVTSFGSICLLGARERLEQMLMKCVWGSIMSLLIQSSAYTCTMHNVVGGHECLSPLWSLQILTNAGPSQRPAEET